MPSGGDDEERESSELGVEVVEVVDGVAPRSATPPIATHAAPRRGGGLPKGAGLISPAYGFFCGETIARAWDGL